MKRIFLTIAILLNTYGLMTSQEISSFLNDVARKNPEIISYQKLLEARKTEARTGLAPPDPFVSAGYMPGKGDDAGIKRTWSVTQSFHFPTKYLAQNKLSKNKIILAEHEFELGKLRLLLDAEQMIFDHIYYRKKLEMLKSRKDLFTRLESAWKRMLTEGEATILDYNKLMYGFASLKLELSRTETHLSILREKLLYASGAEILLPDFSEYPVMESASIETILDEKRSLHPEWLIPAAEYNLSLNEARLARSSSLPGIQAGYGSEIIPGETFTGPFAGLTIPLWSNANRVKSADATAGYASASMDARLLELETKVKSEFHNSRALFQSIAELNNLYGKTDNDLLDKALESGEISLTEYFLYLEASFETEEKLLELENEYYKAMASLYDHRLP
ncbi:MAG: TolC family protein [Bacteroidales bacterium]|jgi:outer membrane protein TolC|nr:TolC family protein [Bacteroidales bacterium]